MATFNCDACGHQVDGYTRKELQADGWQWHDLTDDRTFVMCGACIEKYAERRLARAQLA